MDTMVDHLKVLHHQDGFYDFKAGEVRVRCMPHTVHLSALEASILFLYYILIVTHSLLQLLKAIGAFNANSKLKKKRPPKTTYQDSVAAPLDREFDHDTVDHDDEEEEGDDEDEQEGCDAETEMVLKEVLSSVQKVCGVVLHFFPLLMLLSYEKSFERFVLHLNVVEHGQQRSIYHYARLPWPLNKPSEH